MNTQIFPFLTVLITCTCVHVCLYFSTQPPSQVDCDLTAELEQLSQGVHFKDLTISSQEHHQPPPLLTSTTQGEGGDGERASFVPMAGQCSNRLHFNMASRSPAKKSKMKHGGVPIISGGARHCRVVSQKWLERCKPDLTEFESEPADSVRLSDSEREMEGHSGEDEIEEEIEEDSDLEGSDGLCEEDLWEEEEEEGEEGEEQGVEPEAFDLEECIHDNHQEGEEELHSPRLYSDDLNRIVGRSNLDLDDERQGYSWDDNDEGSSHDDSSSEEDPVINSRLSEQFDTKWEELSKSVTLSPLKQQLPVVKSSSSPQTNTSPTLKKRLILTPRVIPSSSQSSTKTVQRPTSCTTQPSRDGMSLLELYGSKGQPAAAQSKATPSLVQQLSLNAESANQRPSIHDGRNSDKKKSLWTLERSDYARDFVNVNSSASLGCDIHVPREIISTDLPSHQSDAKPPPLSPQDSSSNRGETRSAAPGDSSILASLDREMDASHDRRAREGSSITVSDIDLLSQEEPCVLSSRGSAVSMATTSTSRGSGLRRRGRERKVHSTAAVISEVEQLEHSEEATDTLNPSRTACSELPVKYGAGRDSKLDETKRERKVASYDHSR